MTEAHGRLKVLSAIRPETSIDASWPESSRESALRQVMTRVEGSGQDLTRSDGVDGRERWSRRQWVMAGGVLAVIVVVAGAIPLKHPPKSYAATPPMLTFSVVSGEQRPRSVLKALAVTAGVQPHPAGSGRFNYIHSKGWYLHTSADQQNRILDFATAELDRRLWLAADGSGRLQQVTEPGSDQPMHLDKTLQPGEFDGRFLSADATLAAVQARFGYTDTAAGWFAAIHDMWSQQVVPPALQARVLSHLSIQSGLSLLGDTTDRAGRHGIAFSVVDNEHGPSQRRILVFSPDTGAVLDSESVILEDSELPVQPPATIAYTLWITGSYTPTVIDMP